MENEDAARIRVRVYKAVTPRFSVIVPAYNVEDVIESTLNSLTACLTDEFELIVVNDESTDDTAARIDKALHGAKCHAYRVDIEHAGVSCARNEGLRMAQGEYVAFVDGDDMVTPDYAETLLSYTRERKPDAVFFGMRGDSSHFSATVDYAILGISGNEAIVRRYLKNEFMLSHVAAVYSRAFLERERLQYMPGCIRAQDLEFMLKTLLCAERVDICPQKLYIYARRGSSITHAYNPRWYDSTDAMLRTVGYAVTRNAPAPVMQALAMLVVYTFIHHRARALRIGHMSLRELEREIARNYPDQKRKTIDCAKKYLPLLHKNRLALLAYRINPTAAFALLRLVTPEIFA